MRIDRALLLLLLVALLGACPSAAPSAEASAGLSTLRLLYETSRATRLSVDRHALAPRVAASGKTIAWRAEGAAVTVSGSAADVAAAGGFTLTTSIPVTRGVEYAIRASSTKEVLVEARPAGDPTTAWDPALVTTRADGFDYTIGIFAETPALELRVTGKGDVKLARFDIHESLLREPIELLSAEDAAIRAIVTHGRGGTDYQEREALLAIGETAYEWPLPPAQGARVLDIETGVALRHGDDAGTRSLDALVEVHAHGVWRQALRVERGAPGDDGAWRREQVPLDDADAVRLSTHPRVAGDGPTVTVAWGRPVIRPAVRSTQPDVILITIDALRADKLGAYGSTLGLSPNFDRIAKDSVVFEEARTARGETWESTTAIAFATWPEDVGVTKRGDRTVHGTKGMADAFGSAGYFTARLGNVLVMPGQLGGFDVSEDAARDEIAIARLLQLLKEEHDRPKLIWVHLTTTHYPYHLAPEFLPPGAPKEMDVPWFYDVVHDAGPPDAIATISARADAAVRQVDAQVGAFLPALADPSRPGGPAIVAISADHGSQRGEQGLWFMHGTYSRAVLRVPLLLWWPGHLAARRVDPLVRTIDYGPTLLDLAGLPHDQFTGKSLVPLARGEAMEPLTNMIRDAGSIFVVENDRYKVVAAVNATKTWAQARMTVTIPDLQVYRWRSDPAEVRELSESEPLVAGELLSHVLHPEGSGEQQVSPEAVRLLRQAGYAGDH